MNHKELIKKFWQLFSNQKWDESKTLFHPDFTCYYPQSKEKFVGAENFVEMNRAYPGQHRAEINHLVQEGDSVVCGAFISADTGQTTFVSSFFEIKDNLIFKATEYWSDEYAAPDNRKQWRT